MTSSVFSQWVGVLAGSNAGTISNVTATGQVNGGSIVGVKLADSSGKTGRSVPGDYAGTITNSICKRQCDGR